MKGARVNRCGWPASRDELKRTVPLSSTELAKVYSLIERSQNHRLKELALRSLQLVFLLAILILAPSVELSADPKSAEVGSFEWTLEKARKHLSAKRYEKAMPYFAKANALVGGSCGDCLQGLGIAASRSQNPEAAILAYEQLLELGGDRAFGALQRVIRLSLRIGQPLRGASACHFFIRHAEKSERQAIWALNELGLLLVESNDDSLLEEALTAFYSALDRNGGVSEILQINASEVEWLLGREDAYWALVDDPRPEEAGLQPSFREIEIFEIEEDVENAEWHDDGELQPEPAAAEDQH